MVYSEIESVYFDTDGANSGQIPWSFEANWIIAHGSLQSSLSVESSDHPIAEPDPRNTATKCPLILRPRAPDSAPCEIKISFKQTYEIAQIYVRSTARAYEIYYETSPQSTNEYLSTIRCGVAERDDQVLQTSCVEDVAEEQMECLSGYLAAETASSGGSIATNEDDWVKIKVPGSGSSPASDKTNTNGLSSIQDLYEATAEISDSDPCLSLTIRLLSLQDKEHVYVDEIYVFVDPVESTDSGDGAALAGSSAQSSLMAMFMPTLLQLTKSSLSGASGKSDEVLKNSKMESTPTITAKIDSLQQIVKPKELCKDTTDPVEHQQHSSANKCGEEKIGNGFQPSRIETAMEQLVSRLSRVEDICLRFEEKMLKPIERIESRLQQVENQLEKLAKSSHDFGLPHCTRISAPAFSCSESNSSSFYNNQPKKKDFTCDSMPDLSIEARFNPGLIISAPEFSYGEDDEDYDGLKQLKDSPPAEPKKTLSVDDALAAALNGFMSAAVYPSELIQIPTGLLGDVNEEIQYQEHAKSCQNETRELPAAENSNTESSSQYIQVLAVTAPDFTVDDTGSEEHAKVLAITAPDIILNKTGSEEQLNFVQSSSDVASGTEATEGVQGNEMVPPSISSAESCNSGGNESTDELISEHNGDSSAPSVMVSRTCLDNGLLIGNSTLNMIETYFEGDTSHGPAEISNAPAPNSAKDSAYPISDETNLEKLTTKPDDDRDAASEELAVHESGIDQNVGGGSFEDDAEHVLDPSNVALPDFEFPILEVKFASNLFMSTKSAIEALLDDEASAETDTEAPSINTSEEINPVSTNGNETGDVFSKNCPLLDLEIPAADASHSPCPPSVAAMGVSLI